jgi:polysaccharide biosynthesis transport protein
MTDQSTPLGSSFPEPPHGNIVRVSPSLGGRMGDQIVLPRLDSGYTFREFWEVLRRRRTLLFGCVALLTLASVIIAVALPKRYVVDSLVILDTRRPEIDQQVAVLPNLVTGNPTDPAVVRSEVAVLTSPAYARRVIEHLNLLDNSVFQSEMSQPSWIEGLHRTINEIENAVVALLGREPAVDTTTPVDRAIQTFSRHLSIDSDDRSYAIKLRYEAQDPRFAALVVDTLAELYISDQVDRKRDMAHHAVEWLRQQLVLLQAKLSQSEREIAEFEQQHHLETVISGSVSEQRLHELNQRLMSASEQLVQKQATLSQIEDRLKSAGGAEAAAQVLASPLIQKLREQQSEAQSQVASFKGAFANLDDRRAEARAKEIGRLIETEVQRIVASLRGEVIAAQIWEGTLRAVIGRQQAEVDSANSARVQLKQLEREASATRAVYDGFLLRSQQLEAAENSQQADARVVRAEIPTQPSSPNTSLLIGFGFFGSLFLGFVLAFTAERLNETIRTPEHAERLTGSPVIGFVPRVRSGSQALAAVVDSPLSAYSDAINNILVVLRTAQLHDEHRVIAVSSALPGEGKTMIAAALARAATMTNTRTLLIDCDFRRPAIGRLFGQETRPGIETMFAENSAELSRFVIKDEASRLHYLSTRRASSNPQHILGSGWMADLISRARGEYDLILLDTPPLLAVADALLLSRLADTTLLVVRWAHTPSRAIAETLRLLRIHSGRASGIILSQVNMGQYLKYCSRGRYYYDRSPRSLTVRDG